MYEANLVTIPFLLAARWCRLYDSVHYVVLSRRGERFAGTLLNAGIGQISEKDTFDGAYYEGRVNVMATATALSHAYPWFGRALSRIGRSPDYAALMEQIFLSTCWGEASIAPFLLHFFRCRENEGGTVTFFSWTPERAFGWAASLPSNVRIVSWHRYPLAIAKVPGRLAMACFLLAFPFLDVFYLLRKGVLPNGRGETLSRPVLLFHREGGDLQREATRYRNMYFLRSKALSAADCLHALLATSDSFSPEKRRRLEAEGGKIVSLVELGPTARQWGGRILVDPWRGLPTMALMILACPLWTWAATRALLETLHFIPLASFLLDRADCPVVIFETEGSMLAQVVAIEARRRGRRSASMLHGLGAQPVADPTRFQLQIDELITYGRWDDALRAANPRIGRCVPCGNIEIDHLDRSGNFLPPFVRERRGEFRLVGYLARLHHVLITQRSALTNSLYADPRDDLSREYLGPFLRWVADRPDIVLVWKTPLRGFGHKGPDGQVHWDDWIAPLMTAIPSERLVVIPDAALEDVVGSLDVAIGNDASSAIGCCLSAGIPCVSFDLVYGGIFRRYHPMLAAMTGPELVTNVEYWLENRIPSDVLSHFNLDFYGMEAPDFHAGDRVRAYFRNLVCESSHLHI